MNKKYEIEIPGLPEGWRPVAFRIPGDGEWAVTPRGEVVSSGGGNSTCYLIVEKIKPRRVTFEETDEYFKLGQSGYYFLAHSRTFGFASSAAAVHLGNKIWRKVKEEE